MALSGASRRKQIPSIESLQRIEPPWRAIKEWIAGAPLWPCELQDPPPDLVFHDAPPSCGKSIPDDEPNLNWFNQPRNARIQSQDFDDIDQSPTWQASEILLDEGRTLVLEYI